MNSVISQSCCKSFFCCLLASIALLIPLHSARADAITLPFYFEHNIGQSDPDVHFLARIGQTKLFLTTDGLLLVPPAARPVHMQFAGGNPAPELVGEAPLSAHVNYLRGNSSGNWTTGVDLYTRVRYREIYPGIDVVFYSRNGALEYDFVIAAGADPDQIRVNFDGVDAASLHESGNLLMQTGQGLISQSIPATYQLIDGQRDEVAARQGIDSAGMVQFALAEYQREHTLVLDPALTFSRFFGGNGEEEVINITTDRDGNIYLTGGSSSSDLPITQNSLAYPADMFKVEGNRLAFIAKFDPTGKKLVYMTYLGGSKTSTSHFVRVDADGNAHVAGRTEASDFPLVNPIQSKYAGGSDDLFISKLNADGSALIYSTYIGGSEYDQARSLALDDEGSVYVTGRTDSTDYPVVNPIIASYAGEQDGFVTKISPDGSRIVYSTYLGGSKNDIGHAITVDADGNAYVTGLSNSTDFPVVGAYQSAYKGGDGDDTIVTKLNAAGSAFVYSTFVGGSGDDESRSIQVDAAGNAVISGYTRSTDFPLVNALQNRFGGGTHDIFVTSVNAQGSGLNWSTYLGGSGNDYGRGLALDPAGNIYLTGYTNSMDFPLQQPLQDKLAGAADTFIVKLAPQAERILYSTYIGGSTHERGRAISVDVSGNILVSGHTESKDFPVSESVSPAFGGGADEAFIIKLAP